MLGFNIGKFVNPADSFIKVVAIDYPKSASDEKKIE